MQTVRARPALAILIAILVLFILTGVVYAIGRSLGYIPGIGLVDNSSPLRVLAEPVSLTRDGITVTVAEVILSTDKTVIRFAADPVSSEKLAQDAMGCEMSAELELPGGSFVKLVGTQRLPTGYNRLTFEPVPADVNEATLILPCIPQALPGALPENWELPLRFVSAPAEITVIPVIEVTPSQESSDGTPVVLEKVIETETGYTLAGKFHSIGLPKDAKAIQFSNWPTIIDASGRSVPFTFANSELNLLSETTEPGTFAWAVQIEGKSFHWPLTIRFDTVAVEYENVQKQFEFDAGPNPQDGQAWDLNIDLGELAGFPVRVTTVIGRPDGYEFYFQSPHMFHGINVEIGDSIQGLTGMDAPGEFSSSVTFADEIPSGKLTVLVSRPVVALPGVWQLQWEPENASVLPTPGEAPQVCLTVDSLQAALANPMPIPADLSGKVFFHASENNDGVTTYVSHLNGSNKQEFGQGMYVVPSPDGSQVAYNEIDGLYIKDIATGEAHYIPNTITGDFGPAWSPDGARLAFMRDSESSLYVINLDGTGLQRMDRGPEFEKLIGWSPDGAALFYNVYTGEGNLLRKVDLASGTVNDLFDIGTASMFASISPDGTKVVFFKSITDTVNGMYVSSLDGSNRQLIAQSDVTTEAFFDHPVFSPDGKWLLMSIVLDPKNEISVDPGMALVNLETCQIIPLTFDGWLSSWIP